MKFPGCGHGCGNGQQQVHYDEDSQGRSQVIRQKICTYTESYVITLTNVQKIEYHYKLNIPHYIYHNMKEA